MPVGFPASASAVTITTTTPTTILNGIISGIDDIDLPDPIRGNVIGATGGNARVIIRGSCGITLGAGATSISMKCFNNNGAQIGATRTKVVTASTTDEISFFFVDTAPVANNVYSVQFTVNAATANSTVNVVNAVADAAG